MEKCETYLAVNGMVTREKSWCFLNSDLGNSESGEVVVVMGEEEWLYGVRIVWEEDCRLRLTSKK